jgi:class 3 adenylate cyclase
MHLLRDGGARTRRLVAFLRRRARAAPARRPTLDCKVWPDLFRRRAVVFTDTADSTLRTARDGVLHCLMLFERLMPAIERAVRAERGEIVKFEGDSFLLRFPDAMRACRAVAAIDRVVARSGRGAPHERLRFSYGIGFGDVLDLEHDLFGVEVSLASKLGEDLAQPGEALLTPAAAAALDRRMLRRVVPYRIVTFETAAIPVQRLKLARPAAPGRPRAARA